MTFLNLSAIERLLFLAACAVLLTQLQAPGFGGSGFAERKLGPCTAIAHPAQVGVTSGERCPLRSAAAY